MPPKHEMTRLKNIQIRSISDDFQYFQFILSQLTLCLCIHIYIYIYINDELDHYVYWPHIWLVARTAFPHLEFESLFDRLCVDNPCIDSLKVLAATFPAYRSIKPSLGNAPLSFVTARCQCECSFYTAVRAAGLSPDTPAD